VVNVSICDQGFASIILFQKTTRTSQTHYPETRRFTQKHYAYIRVFKILFEKLLTNEKLHINFTLETKKESNTSLGCCKESGTKPKDGAIIKNHKKKKAKQQAGVSTTSDYKPGRLISALQFSGYISKSFVCYTRKSYP